MKKYLIYLLGMNILVLGITCNTLSNLGVGLLVHFLMQ